VKLVFQWWLTPKRPAFPSLDRYYKATIVEYRKSYEHRHPVAEPSELPARAIAMPAQVIAMDEAGWWLPQSDLDLLEVALAVHLYRLANARYPTRLSDTRSRWLPAVPTDPWGKPVAYRLKSGTPLIYSLGPDGRDDGGRPADASWLKASTRGDLVWGSLSRRRH
jgi:hypothetical protein